MRNKSAALLIVLAFVAACSKKTADSAVAADSTAAATTKGAFTVTPEQQSRIHLVVATESSFQPSIEVTGTVAFNGDRSTQVLSPVSGPVSQLFAQVGTSVARGTPLAAVASPDFAAAIATYRKAQSSYRNLQRIADQDVQLFKTDAIAKRDVDAAQVDAAAAASDRDAALEQLRALGVNPSAVADGSTNAVSALIRAPIEGVVVERLINPGQLLQAGTTPAFTIADLSTMWVLANVFEADLPSIRKGQLATITSSGLATSISGRVDYVAALVDPASRATSVRITVPNHNQMLKKDMYVKVSINSDQTRSGILVPEAAVLRDEQNLPFVFVQTGNGQYSRRSITLGTHVGSNYEIASGVTPGEKVVAEGALFLQFAESQ
jgi:membrane fusion protein, heavy metal efflux system